MWLNSLELANLNISSAYGPETEVVFTFSLKNQGLIFSAIP